MTQTPELPEGMDYGDILRLAEGVSQHRDLRGLPQAQVFEIAYAAILAAVLNGEWETEARNPLGYLAGLGRMTVRRFLATRPAEHSDLATTTSEKWFRTYWTGDRGVEPNHAPAIDEQLALWQVLEGLTPEQRGDLVAFAASPDAETAAVMRGCTRIQLYARLASAREAFFKLWFEPDRPREVGRVVRQHGGGSKHKPGQGVYFNHQTGKWFGRGHKRMYLGSYSTKEEAQAVVDAYWAEREEGI